MKIATHGPDWRSQAPSCKQGKRFKILVDSIARKNITLKKHTHLPAKVMKKAEILHQVKQVEAEIRTQREMAKAERERILREARRSCVERLATANKEADSSYQKILTQEKARTTNSTSVVVANGRELASQTQSRGMANLPQAARRMLERFEVAVNA